jgi:C4-dicarboxylate-specific signal transduction histidine kinase
VGRRVQQQSTQVSSQRVTDRIANLRRALARHRELPAVAEFARSLPKPLAGAA